MAKKDPAVVEGALRVTREEIAAAVLAVLHAYTSQSVVALEANAGKALSTLMANSNTAYGFLTKRLRGLIQYYKPSATILRAEVQAKKSTIQDIIDLVWKRVQ